MTICRARGALSRYAALLLGCALLAVLPGTGRGMTRAELYQATVPQTERSEAGQSAAFEAAMRVVLVRVTGRRNAGSDPALEPLVRSARRYVQQYRSAGEGLTWVAFDGAAIERWLTQNGQPLWGHTRPVTLVLLAVPNGASGSVLTQSDTTDLKSAVDAAAAERGVPLQWPSAADLQREHLDYATVTGGAAGTLVEAAHRLGGEAMLIGRAQNASIATPIRWSLLFQERSSEFTADAAEGPNRAADLYAGLFAASGALAPVAVEVSGVRELKDYAQLQGMLESLALVTHVDVEELSGDTVHLRLMTRGGSEALAHVLALDARLHAQPSGENGALRYQLRR